MSRSEPGEIHVGKIAEFPENKGREIRIGGRRIAVFNVQGQLFAIKNLCPHQGEPLHRLPPRGKCVVCPGHGWRFDVSTGECTRGDQSTRIATYRVVVREEEVFVDTS